MEDEVTDVIEDVVDVAKKNGLLIPVALGLLVVGAGVGIGYLIGQRKKYEVIKLGDRPQQAPPKIVIDAKDLASQTFRDAGKQVDDILIEQHYVEENEDIKVTINDTVVTTETSNIFAHDADDDEWNYEEEISKRKDTGPYIIHSDEYYAEDPDTEELLDQQLVYYAGDNVLTETVSGNIRPIHNHESMVGKLRFGHGSGDPNVVYVRNLTRNAQYEILRDPGHYRIEVLGLEMEEAATLLEKKEERARQQRFRPE